MLFVFDLVSIFLIALDKRRYKSIFTPFICFVMAYLVLINLNNLIMARYYDYFFVSNCSLRILLIFFIIISLISNFFACFIKNRKARVQTRNYNNHQKHFIIFLFTVGLFAYLLSLIINIKTFGFSNIKRTNNGILAHIGFMCQICAPVIIFLFRPQKKHLAFLLVGLVFIIAILYSQKYVIFINALYLGLYIIIDKSIKFSKIIKWLFILALVALLVFLFAYGLIPSLNDKSNESLSVHMNFAVKNFFMYLLSPIIANNYSLTNSLPNGEQIAFCMPINIFRALFGNKEYISPVHEFVFEYSMHEFTNVSGILGELTYCLGIIGAILYISSIFIIIYIFYVNLRNTNRYKMTTCFLMAVLIFSFFCNFFTVSGMIMQLLYTFIVETILQLLAGTKVETVNGLKNTQNSFNEKKWQKKSLQKNLRKM